VVSRIAATALRGAPESQVSDGSRGIDGAGDGVQPAMVQTAKNGIDKSSISSNHLVAVEDPVIRDEYVIVRRSAKVEGSLSKSENSTLLDPVQRHLAYTTAEQRTVLIVRANNAGVSEAQMLSSVHSDVKRQMELCSQGLVRILPPRYSLPAVINVAVGMSITYANMDAFADAAERAAEQQLNNRYKLREVADHILFVLPYIQDFSAKGELGKPQSWRAGALGYTSKFSSNYAPSLSILMHELVSLLVRATTGWLCFPFLSTHHHNTSCQGHNLGLHHAGFQSKSSNFVCIPASFMLGHWIMV
jgi:hypothetical protein